MVGMSLGTDAAPRFDCRAEPPRADPARASLSVARLIEAGDSALGVPYMHAVIVGAARRVGMHPTA